MPQGSHRRSRRPVQYITFARVANIVVDRAARPRPVAIHGDPVAVDATEVVGEASPRGRRGANKGAPPRLPAAAPGQPYLRAAARRAREAQIFSP